MPIKVRTGEQPHPTTQCPRCKSMASVQSVRHKRKIMKQYCTQPKCKWEWVREKKEEDK